MKLSMNSSFLRFVFAVTFPLAVHAEADQYSADLAGLYGEIQQVQAMRDICARDFPAYSPANSAAVEDWRARNSAVVVEIESRWQRWLEQKAAGSPNRRESLDAWSKNLYESTKRDFYIHLKKDGDRAYQARCESFPQYLLGAKRMQLGVAFSDVLQRIRQTPH